ncbi:aminoacyl-tRNA hydrolase [Maritalea sp.]|uniref:aminoacyl-tRNA hydrolase n=1 Tax=Maritalea sp. TaxID=2003361 RepID=UPI0039E46309
MHLLVGLGNPGKKYQAHRHNVGFMAVDAIASRHNLSPYRSKFNAQWVEGTIDGERVILLKPQTFMNDSGTSVGAAAKFFKLAPSDITVLYDELDLAPGKIKVKTGGGNGGHNGIRSMEAHLGKDFHRVRIGIGHPGHKDRVHNHVLSDFAKADNVWLAPLLDAIGENAGLLASGQASSFMNKIALAVNGDAPKAKAEKPVPKKQSPKLQSHVHQARTAKITKLPETGPMANMLKKLFGKGE